MIKLLHDNVFLYFSGFLTLVEKDIVSAAEVFSMGSVGFVRFICWLGGTDY